MTTVSQEVRLGMLVTPLSPQISSVPSVGPAMQTLDNIIFVRSKWTHLRHNCRYVLDCGMF